MNISNMKVATRLGIGTATAKQNADDAHHANMVAASASDIAVKVGQVASQGVNTIVPLTASTQKIVDIIGVIDDIAFQTNILALCKASIQPLTGRSRWQECVQPFSRRAREWRL